MRVVLVYIEYKSMVIKTSGVCVVASKIKWCTALPNKLLTVLVLG